MQAKPLTIVNILRNLPYFEQTVVRTICADPPNIGFLKSIIGSSF